MMRTKGETQWLGAIAEYFESRDEVSCVYASVAGTRGQAAIAVLIHDAGLSGSDMERFRAEYLGAVSGMVPAAVVITVLNAAPPFTKCRILGTWQLLRERNRPFRSWFERQAVFEYRSLSAVA